MNSPKKKILANTVLIFALILIICILFYQNLILSTSNEELTESNKKLSEKNAELSAELANVTSELTFAKQNFSSILRSFGNDSNPLIETRLGIELIDRITLGDNYLWITGEIENKENVTVYDVALNFTLYTYQGIDNAKIIIGNLEPHQVVAIRTSVMTSFGKIVNWNLEPIATYLP